jgi:hypothetical protein
MPWVLLVLVGGACEPDPLARYGVDLQVDVHEEDEAPTWTLRNVGNDQIGYGHPFDLERRGPQGWVEMRTGCFHTLEMILLGPGETATEDIYLCLDEGRRTRLLGPGVYRVTHSVSVGAPTGRAKDIEVSDTFEVP